MLILKRFLKYVEIQTKIASLLPFLLGLGYVLYVYGQFSIINTVLFFASMLFFDMATTALNNYIDIKTNGKELQFSKIIAKRIFFILLILAILAGICLVLNTSLIVLFCGGLCFAVGIFYTFGPAPISRMPLGEIFSGIFMGFFIPFLVVFINAPGDSLVYFSLNNWILQLWFNLAGLLQLGIITIPAICGIANIMLANNICDVEEDIKVNRFTLPYYIGNQNALSLFAGLYYLGFAAIIAIALLKILPIYVLFVLLALIIVQKNIVVFRKQQSKEKTFALSVQNLVLTLLPLIIVMVTAGIFVIN
ncbi:MAG: 1,4-dihydroxy-2-naphthoate polyprenyltransferase [Eubacteriaceae bacterium]|nr:1,4-dihydroxy-2-naphthoate polyprenyltransferase [Eubacteriaceae bacterium]